MAKRKRETFEQRSARPLSMGLVGAVAVMFLGVAWGSRAVLRRTRKIFENMFPEGSLDELERAGKDIPEHKKWWKAPARPATESEGSQVCRQCNELLAGRDVKQCPSCKVVLHAVCYDRSRDGYQTPDCEPCRMRCCFR